MVIVYCVTESCHTKINIQPMSMSHDSTTECELTQMIIYFFKSTF